jgi:hypothetical protein
MSYEPGTNTFYYKVAAGMIAEAANDFLETLSYETIIKFAVICFIMMALEIPYAQWLRFRFRRSSPKYVS